MIKNVQTAYEVGNCYEFPIVEFNSFLNKRNERVYIVNVKTFEDNIVSVKALEWHNEKIWNYKTLKCEVKGYQPYGSLILVNKDFRHPLYNIRQHYEFTITGNKIKTNPVSGKEYKVFELLGEDNCRHEVNIIPGQSFHSKSGTKVTCEVVSIFKVVRLKQQQAEDPFFVQIDKVISEKELINKYFKVLFENNENDIKLCSSNKCNS